MWVELEMYRYVQRSSLVLAACNWWTGTQAVSGVVTARAPVYCSCCAHYSTGNEEEVVVFYRWPTMRHFRFISRFKVYQVSTMVVLLAPVTHWYASGEMGLRAFALAWVAAIGTTAVLAVLSIAFSRVAGEMSHLPHSNVLRVSTLTFMGYRRDLDFPVGTIVPFADSQLSNTALERLEIEDSKMVLLYSLRYGRVLDSNLMSKVLKM